jgi:glycosyltransferase involved in cell wall biosynthesis
MLMIISFFKNRPVKRNDITAGVSFIITAYNEEKRIGSKIENTLAQDYPKDKLEIIVASDCSNDQTDAIVRSFTSKGVKFVRAEERRGKEHAQKHAITAAAGEILIFSDVATILDPTGVSSIVRNFHDPSVGCVSSLDRFIDKDGKISGESAYVKYEMLLRKLETRVNTLIGLSGSFFAARREVCLDWATDLQSDFNTLINSVKKGLRGVLDHETAGYYMNISEEKKEYDRKMRTVLRGISVFMKNLGMLNVLKYGLFSWQLFSHKLCRWIVPFALITALISNTFLVEQYSLYTSFFFIQCLFYFTAFLGLKTDVFRNMQIFRIPSFFVTVNLSIISAWFSYLRGERMVQWEPSKR